MYECIWSKGLVTDAAVGDIIDVADCAFVVIAATEEPYDSAGTLQLDIADGGKFITVFRSIGDVTVELSAGDE